MIGFKDQPQEGYTTQMIHSNSDEAGPGRPSTPEIDIGQPVPQEVDAKALSSNFELQNPERDDGPDRVTTPLELGCHTNCNV